MATMRRRVVLIAIILSVLGGLAWYFVANRPEQPAANMQAEPAANVPAVVDRPASSRPAAEPAQPLPSAPMPAEELPQPPEGEWLIHGRLEFAGPFGADLLKVLGSDQRLVRIMALDLADPRASVGILHLEADATGRYAKTFEAAYEHLPPNLAAACWEIVYYPRLVEKGALQRAAETQPRPRPEQLQGLATPVITGRRIDLGVLRVDLGAVQPAPWLVKGRAVHESGATLTTVNPMWLWHGQFNYAGRGVSLNCDSTGRFFGLLFNLPAPVAGLAWHLDGPHEFYEETDNSDIPSMPLPAPTVDGQVLDFGDVRIPGVLVEVRAEVEGMPPAKYDYDPAMVNPYDRREPYVSLGLTAHHTDADFAVPLWEHTTRLIVPEARYHYTASLSHPNVIAKDLTAALLARRGKTVSLHLRFVPLPVIPARVVNETGEPVRVRAMVGWKLIAEEPKQVLLEGGAAAPCNVPLEPGTVVEVSAENDDYRRETVTAKYGEKEVVIRLNRPRKAEDENTLVVLLPPSPIPGKELPVRLMVSEGQRPALHSHVNLAPDAAERSRGSVRSGPVSVWLEGGELAGYPPGPLCAPVTVEVIAGKVATVELPKLPAPPGGIVWGEVIASVKCGGIPVGIEALFRDASTSWRRGFDDNTRIGQVQLDRRDLAGGGRNRHEYVGLPEALLDGQREIPTPVVPPDATGGQAVLKIELEPRVSVRVRRGAELLQNFQVDLSSTKGTQCRCITGSGVANLWAPEGRAVFVLWVENTQIVLSDEQVNVDVVAGGLKQVELVIDMLRVEFARAESAEEEDDAMWLMVRLVDGRPTRGEPLFVAPEAVELVGRGRYLLVPEAPLDPASAFEIDLTEDRKVVLPPVKPEPTADVLLKMRDEDWRDFEEIELEYYVATDNPVARTPAFTEMACRASVRVLPDGLEVRGLPLGKQVVLRGYVRWTNDKDGNEFRLLVPLVFKVTEGATQAARWSIPLWTGHDEDGEYRVAVLSDFAGHALPWQVNECLRPGRHEVAVFGPDNRELFRMWVNVPEDDFDINEFIQTQLKERGLLPKAAGD